MVDTKAAVIHRVSNTVIKSKLGDDGDPLPYSIQRRLFRVAVRRVREWSITSNQNHTDWFQISRARTTGRSAYDMYDM